MEKLKLETEPQKVVRSLVVSLAPGEELYEYFRNLIKPSVLRFYLAVKGDGAEERITFFGGRLNPDENLEEAISREIDEELSFRPLGLPFQTIFGSWLYSSKKSGPRECFLTYNPINPINTSEMIINETSLLIGDKKIKKVLVLDLRKLKELVDNGQIEIVENEENKRILKIEGHLSLKRTNDIDIDYENEDIKNNSLRRLLSWMEHIENYLEEQFRLIYERSETKEEFLSNYQKIMARFMRRGLEVGIKRNLEKRQEDFKEEDEKRRKMIQVFNSGFLGKDILYFLPELANHGLDWNGLDNATEGTQTFVEFIKNVFSQFLSQENFTEDSWREFLLDRDKPLEEKTSKLKHLDEIFKERLKQIFGLEDNEIEEVDRLIRDFFRQISLEFKTSSPSLLEKGVYQDYSLASEIQVANWGTILNLFCGFDTKINNPEFLKRLRFESGRHIILNLKALASWRYYNENSRPDTLIIAVNNFFGSETGIKIVELSNGQTLIYSLREGFNNQELIIDMKPSKPFHSFLRKTFEERPENIRDFFSFNVVIPNSAKLSNERRLFFIEDLLKGFIDNLKLQFPDTEIKIIEDKNVGIKNYFEGKTDSVFKGKRRGSQGDRIVRRKIVLSIGNKSIEIGFYPFESIENSDFWGWLEKIGDDPNYVVRRMVASANGIPSFYELLWPSDIYKIHYLHRLNASYYQN